MKPRISMITLGVAEVARAARFYERGLGLPRHPVEAAEVAFFAMQGSWLALYGRADLAQDAGVAPPPAAPGAFSLAHNVADKAEVDAVLAQALAAGARLVKPARNTPAATPATSPTPTTIYGRSPGTRTFGSAHPTLETLMRAWAARFVAAHQGGLKHAGRGSRGHGRRRMGIGWKVCHARVPLGGLGKARLR